MKLVDEKALREFLELKISFKQSKMGKLLKGYDKNSGESILEDKVYYSYKDVDVYINAINTFIEGTNSLFDLEELKYWLMVARGVMIKTIQLEEMPQENANKLFAVFMKFNGLFNVLDSNPNIKKENVVIYLKVVLKMLLDIKGE